MTILKFKETHHGGSLNWMIGENNTFWRVNCNRDISCFHKSHVSFVLHKQPPRFGDFCNNSKKQAGTELGQA